MTNEQKANALNNLVEWRSAYRVKEGDWVAGYNDGSGITLLRKCMMVTEVLETFAPDWIYVTLNNTAMHEWTLKGNDKVLVLKSQ